MKRVLIACQSTIPHYRVPFYNTLERIRPDAWRFDVVFDPSEAQSRRFFKEPVDLASFAFPILETRTLSMRALSKRVSYQTFWLKAAQYDLVIVGSALSNLTYPLCQLWQVTKTRFAHWGHGQDRSADRLSLPKSVMERFRILLARRTDGFFAYTPGVKSYLVDQGLSPRTIFVLNNTIDIEEQRLAYERWRPKREAIRKDLGVQGKKVLLFVGRFTPNKRIGFLLESFSILRQADPSFHLVLVGSGGQAYLGGDTGGITYFGPIVELSELAPIYVASDLFTFPGSVGLGPLQALCYDLPVITVDSLTHMPEIEYLGPANSILLEVSTTPEQYAQAIANLFAEPGRLDSLKSSIWPSIRHLTIDQMARNFVQGVNTILAV